MVVVDGKFMSYSHGDGSAGLTIRKSKFSYITLIVFLTAAVVCLYLNLIGVINSLVYYGALFGLLVVYVFLTFLGKNSKKRYT
ncbi:MAG: hypothetical protein FWD52_02280 [Candidatus Bathyarchaeota archaeon]|nr:hypothetical protein [Candidatus Termiticorpusculum sp.]